MSYFKGAYDLEPVWTTDFRNPPPTTPQEPQNLLRPTLMNGLGVSTTLTESDFDRVIRDYGPYVVLGGAMWGGYAIAAKRTDSLAGRGVGVLLGFAVGFIPAGILTFWGQ
jgi:hypothetical protein